MGYFKSAVEAARRTGRVTRSAALKTAATAGKIDRGITRIEDTVDKFKQDARKAYTPAGPSHAKKKTRKKRPPARQYNPFPGFC